MSNDINSLLDNLGSLDEMEIELDREMVKRKGGYYDFLKAGWHTVEPSPFIEEEYVRFLCEHMEELMLGRLDSNRLLINIPPGHSKPIWVGEPVLTTRGRIPLGEVVVGDEVLTHRGRYRRVSAVHEQGKIPVVRVTTQHGREVLAAPDHPFLTTGGWKCAGDLDADVLGVVLSQPAGREELSEEEARFLGYMVGDGSCKYEQAQFCNADKDILDDFTRCAESLGIEASKRYQKQDCENTWTIALRGGRPSRVWEVLERHGLRGKSSYTKRVPTAILDGGANTIANFLGAYWSCDGHVKVKHRKRYDEGRQDCISYVAKASTVSRDLAYDLQHIALRLGIHLRVRRREVNQKTKRQGDTYVSYDIQTQSQDGVALISALPGLCSAKQAPRAKRRAFGLFPLLSDPVASVEGAGEEECRCLTVEEDSSFTVQDLAVHNSMTMVVMSLPFLWAHDPTAVAIYAHKDQALARDMARKTRQVVTSEWYQARWGHIKLQDDATKIDRFSNNFGGGRVAVTVRMQITGAHAKGTHGGLIVVDDPNRPDDTLFDYGQVNTWYSQTLPTRFADLQKSQICIVQQRISNSDLSAYVLASDEGYTHVCLPMEYDPKRHCKTALGEDWRTEPGELLSPKRNTPEGIARLKEVFKDPRIAQAQLNQNPVLQDGNIFTVSSMNNRYDVLPPSVQYTISCDLTFTGEKTSDYAVCQTWARGVSNAKHYLVDQLRRKMGFTATVEAILHLLKKFPEAQLLVEKSANGFAVVDLLKKAGVERIHEFSVGKTGKVQRAATVSYLFDRGDVLFPRDEPAWFVDYQRELTGFPGGSRHDDQVDATVNYLSWVSGSAPVDLAGAFRFAGELAKQL